MLDQNAAFLYSSSVMYCNAACYGGFIMPENVNVIWILRIYTVAGHSCVPPLSVNKRQESKIEALIFKTDSRNILC